MSQQDQYDMILAKLDKLQSIDNNVADMSVQVINLEESISTLSNEWLLFTDSHAASQTSITNDISDIRSDLRELKEENRVLSDANKSLRDQLNRLESHSRRQNLIFQNIPDDTIDISNKMAIIFKSMKIKDSDQIIIDEAHRLRNSDKSKLNPVIVRFLKRSDRNKVWEARRHTPTPYIINEDLPDDYKKARGRLIPVMKAAKAAGLKSTLIMDKVKIEGKMYSTDQLNELPDRCNLSISCQKQSDKVMCFFGRYSPLSNFYKCSFTLDGTTYNCSEQFIQQKRCEYLGQEAQAQRILAATDPSTQKRLANAIRTDPRPWFDVARSEILPAIRAKFTQNHDLATHLMNTGTRDLAEATTDTYWGTGMSLNNMNILNKSMWSGKNVMGSVLMVVRAELVANK
jgi:ribA/ribD-fused uncharacterized protein